MPQREMPLSFTASVSILADSTFKLLYSMLATTSELATSSRSAVATSTAPAGPILSLVVSIEAILLFLLLQTPWKIAPHPSSPSLLPFRLSPPSPIDVKEPLTLACDRSDPSKIASWGASVRRIVAPTESLKSAEDWSGLMPQREMPLSFTASVSILADSTFKLLYSMLATISELVTRAEANAFATSGSSLFALLNRAVQTYR